MTILNCLFEPLQLFAQGFYMDIINLRGDCSNRVFCWCVVLWGNIKGQAVQS